MSPIKIHPDFRLQGQSFKDQTALINFVKTHYYDSFEFIQQLFDDSETIVVQTSGSTGTPKKIKVLKTAMIASAVATGQFFNLPEKTTALHCLSSGFIAGKMMWVRALHLGWHLSLVPPNKKPLLDKDESFDFCAMVPLQVQNSLESISQIKKLIIGGAPLTDSLAKRLLDYPTEVFQTYGMTETLTHIAVKQLLKGEQTYYQALLGVSFSIDNRGCLLVDAPKINREVQITNDIVQLHSSSSFSWLGRYDNVINSGGLKIFPEQIEQKIAPYIKENFFVSTLKDDRLGQKLVLLIESNIPLEKMSIIWSKASLSRYEIPKEVYFIEKFVYTHSQKINRKRSLELVLKK